MKEEFIKFCTGEGVCVLDENKNLNEQGMAIDSFENTIVIAGAGSGKTTVLSYRFVNLVASGLAAPKDILTITFTKKATAEMKSRIYALLVKAYEIGLVTKDALSDFSNVQISTFDSFCASIVRTSCIEYGIPNDFTIIDNTHLRKLSVRALDFALDKFIDMKSFAARLFSAFDLSALESMFYDLALSHLSFNRAVDAESVRSILLKLIKEKLANLPSSGLRAKDLNSQTEMLEDALLQLKSNDVFFDVFYKLVEEFRKKLNGLKIEAGALTFKDVMGLSLEILKNRLDVRESFQKKFKYIMVDEFQDNNKDNRDLVFYLACAKNVAGELPDAHNLVKNKIFLVGDSKQSIYRFRGADVSVFNSLYEDSKQMGKVLSLSRNWRSEPSVVDFFNESFPSILTCREDYEALYEMQKSKPATKCPEFEPQIKFFKPAWNDSKKKEDFVLEEACHIAKLIQHICNAEAPEYRIPVKNSSGGYILKTPDYSDIAVLFKTTTHQGTFENVFSEYGIPFTCEEKKKLFSDAITGDFYSVIQASLYPHDKVAICALAKSPFFAYKDSDVIEFNKSGFPDEINLFLEDVLKKMAEGSIAATISYLWNIKGYRYYIETSSVRKSYSEHFDSLFSIANDFDRRGANFSEFADFLRDHITGTSTEKTEENVLRETLDGVQLMTIHKSKGLAFPIVFVVEADVGISSSSGAICNMEDDEGNLYVKNFYNNEEKKYYNLYKYLIKETEDAKEFAETKRLLYVAATRVRYHLIFTAGNIPNGDGFYKNGSFALYLKNYFDGAEEYEPVDSEKKEEVYDPSSFFENNKEAEFSEGEKTTSVSALVRESDVSSDAEALASLPADSVIEKYGIHAEFGTLCHAEIEKHIHPRCFSPEDVLPRNLSVEEKNILIHDAEMLAISFIEGKIFKKFENEDYEIAVEKPFVLYNDYGFVYGKIDFIAIKGNSAFILDFKTDRFKAPGKHEAQLDYYKEAVAKMYGIKAEDIETEIVYLREAL